MKDQKVAELKDGTISIKPSKTTLHHQSTTLALVNSEKSLNGKVKTRVQMPNPSSPLFSIANITQSPNILNSNFSHQVILVGDLALSQNLIPGSPFVVPLTSGMSNNYNYFVNCSSSNILTELKLIDNRVSESAGNKNICGYSIVECSSSTGLNIGTPLTSNSTNNIEPSFTACLLSELSSNEGLETISCSQISSVLSDFESGEKSTSVNLGSDKWSPSEPKTVDKRDLIDTSSLLPQEVVKIESKNLHQGKTSSDKVKKSVENLSERYGFVALKRGDKEQSLFKCKDCGFLTLKENVIKEHWLDKHDSNHMINERKQINCIGCDNIFHSEVALLVHLTQDHGMLESEVSSIVDTISSCVDKLPGNDMTDSSTVNNDSYSITPVTSCEDFQAKEGVILNNLVKQSLIPAIIAPGISYKSQESLPSSTVVDPGNNFESISSFPSDSISPSLPLIPSFASSNTPDTNKESDIIPLASSLTLPSSSSDLSEIFTESTFSLNKSIVDYSKNSCVSNNTKTKTDAEKEQDSIKNEKESEDAIKEDKNSLNNVKEIPVTIEVLSKKRGRPRGAQTLRLVKTKYLLCESKSKKNVGLRCGINNCAVRLQNETNMLYHRFCHSDESTTSLRCPECSYITTQWTILSLHLWREHNIDMELYTCQLCGYKTNSYSKLGLHKRIHNEERPFLCDLCGKGFKTPKQLCNHKIIHKSSGILGSVRRIRCDICGREMSDARTLRQHIARIHKKRKPYNCTFCDFTAASSSSLRLHSRQHTGEKPFTCEECNYSSADHNSLRRHKMRHSGSKQYQCPHCPYASIQSTTFKTHLKNKHPGLDDGLMFSCERCPYRTIKKDNLLIHLAEHKVIEEETL